MDKIRIKLNELEFVWLVGVLQAVRCSQMPSIQQRLIWLAVLSLKRRISKYGLFVVKDSNSITLNGAEVLVIWEIIDGAIPIDHEIAWKLSIQQKIEKEVEKLNNLVCRSI